jgi:di/tricarboxylate transporter
MIMSFVREIIDALVKEIKAVLIEYVRETEDAVKKRLQRLLNSGIIVGVLLALVISLIGSAVVFLLIGSLKYLSTLMPAWEAWSVMGLTSAAIGIMLFLALFLFIRKELRTKRT